MRRGQAVKIQTLPDPRYNNRQVQKFINMLMFKGKKSVSERIVYRAFDVLAERTGEEALKAFQQVLENVRPQVEVKSRRVGGATYQVPIEVRYDRSIALAMRWIRESARGRSGKPMDERLAAELVDAFHQTGSVVKKRDDTHKMAEANKAFSHYRW